MGKGKQKMIMSSTRRQEIETSVEEVAELRKELADREAELTEVRERLREQEMQSLRDQVKTLQVSLSETTKYSSENITFNDIENSLTKFSGRDGEVSVKNWVRDFESNSEIFGWSPLKQIVYAKRCLDGPAKLAIKTRDGLNTWTDLKEFLQTEFAVKENAADLHELLRRRKKRSAETYDEYFLAIRELGRRAKLEDNAILKYAIDGIEEEESLKVILYGAQDISEFKEKLRVFTKIFESSKRSCQKKTKSEFTGRKGDEAPRKTRCFACGTEGHLAVNCPQKNSGNKCFVCNSFGHKSVNCPRRKHKEEKREDPGSDEESLTNATS